MNAAPIRCVDTSLPVRGLPERLTCNFISDLHIYDRADLEEFAASLPLLDCEDVLMAGDYVEKASLVPDFLELLEKTGRRFLAVFGNNDREFISEYREKARSDSRVRFLADESVAWRGLTILGTLDCHSREIPATDPPAPPLVVLTHSPDLLLGIAPDRALTLLAGHVHGGQFRLPFWPWWWTHTRIGRSHADGYSRRGAQHIFVGRGIRCSLLKLRNVPREYYRVTFEPEVAREDAAEN